MHIDDLIPTGRGVAIRTSPWPIMARPNTMALLAIGGIVCVVKIDVIPPGWEVAIVTGPDVMVVRG